VPAIDDLIPLNPEDRAILALESSTIAGHTCKVVRLGGRDQLSVERLRVLVSERIARAPALTRRLGGSAAEPGWVADERFDVAEHVLAAPVAGPVDHAGLLALVGELFEQRLDRTRPLWRMDVAALTDGGSALVWRIHHALADGTASLRYARTLLWDHDPETAMSAAQMSAAHAADEVRRRAHLAGFLAREYVRGARRSPLDGPIGTRREVAFAAVSLPDLHDCVRNLCGATVNDGVLAIVTGALARWVRMRHGHLGTIRVKVPVSLHHEGDHSANHDSFFSVAVPLRKTDPVARLRMIQTETRARKAAHDARYREHLLRELSAVPSLEHFVTRLDRSPRTFALNVSNVPGPRAPVSVLNAPVEHLYSIAEIAEHHALRVSAISLADVLCFGLCADAEVIDQLHLLAEGIETEAQALHDAAR